MMSLFIILGIVMMVMMMVVAPLRVSVTVGLPVLHLVVLV
jgi:hypothetical protein